MVNKIMFACVGDYDSDKKEIFKDIWKTVGLVKRVLGCYLNDIVNILFEYYICETIHRSTSHD